jgi:hypothetical protein
MKRRHNANTIAATHAFVTLCCRETYNSMALPASLEME